MTRVAFNGPLPEDIGTGFAQVRSWQFSEGLHPVVAAWFGGRGWNYFVKEWHPHDLTLVSRKAPRDRAQKLLYEHHKKAFPDEAVPLLYRPMDTRRSMS